MNVLKAWRNWAKKSSGAVPVPLDPHAVDAGLLAVPLEIEQAAPADKTLPAEVKLTDVFGLNRVRNLESYVVRRVEEEIAEQILDESVTAIVIYGMSKQGKSSLRRHVLAQQGHLFWQADRKATAETLYKSLLAECGVLKQQHIKGGAAVEVEGDAWVVKVKGSVKGEVVYEPVHFELSDADSVAKTMAKWDDRRIVVIENFHHFKEEVQRDLAVAIRSFETYGYRFVVIGTWSEVGYLQAYNVDLGATVREHSFREWNFNELKSVLERGSKKLNIELSRRVQQSLIHNSLDSVALLQELVRTYLSSKGIKGAQARLVKFDDVEGVADAAKALQTKFENDAIRQLTPISRIGSANPFVDGRSRSWWALQAYLDMPHTELRDGSSVKDLLARTNKMAGERAAQLGVKFDPVGLAEFTTLLNVHWHGEQIKSEQTAVLAYNEVTKRLQIVDAFTKFGLRTREQRQKTMAGLD